MNVWELSFTAKQFVLDFGMVGLLLLVATLCRRYVAFFQRFLIPNNLIAGFLGLIVGPELLGWLDFSPERMGVYVYHLLALTFIGVGLRDNSQGRTREAVHLGFIKVSTYILQALIGLAVAFVALYLFAPDLVPAVGMLLPLGFGMGPGIAYSVGQGWEQHGFAGASDIGLTLSALGFLVAYLTGVMVVNRGIRAGKAALVTSPDSIGRDMRTGIVKEQPPLEGGRLTFFSGAIESLTFHFALVGGVYLLTYGVSVVLAEGLILAGQPQEVTTLWSFNFILANLLALAVRKGMDARKVAYVIDDGLINRITGLLADLLVTTAIMAISLSIAWAYAVPIGVMALLGALATYATIKYAMPRVIPNYAFERTVGLYAEQTGTISSGLALIRVTDPEYSLPVAQDQVLGNGMALLLGFPLLILINMPVIRFGGSMEGYVIVIGLLLAYLVLMGSLWWLFHRLRPNPTPSPAGTG